MAEGKYKYLYIAAAGHVSHDGRSVLRRVTVNKGTASAVVAIYDATAAVGTGGTLIASIDASSKSNALYDVECNNGVYVNMTGANADVTVSVE